jgi:hypothetical protein
VLPLRQLALAEQYYYAIMNRVAPLVAADRDEYEEIAQELDATLVDRYFCNFSLFQSLPDNWAIDQLFPIMPVHRLAERPRARHAAGRDVRLDGKIDRFVGGKQGRPSSSCTSTATARTTSSASSSPAPTRRSSATCTTCSATPTRSTSSSPAAATRSPTSYTATP